VVTTEKDAVKLATLPLGAVSVWVVPLDLVLPPELVRDLCTLLARRRTPAPPKPTPKPTPDAPP
jgi:tetraacyldisaccharide-1-P 4'-kinase